MRAAALHRTRRAGAVATAGRLAPVRFAGGRGLKALPEAQVPAPHECQQSNAPPSSTASTSVRNGEASQASRQPAGGFFGGLGSSETANTFKVLGATAASTGAIVMAIYVIITHLSYDWALVDNKSLTEFKAEVKAEFVQLKASILVASEEAKASILVAREAKASILVAREEAKEYRREAKAETMELKAEIKADIAGLKADIAGLNTRFDALLVALASGDIRKH